MEEKRTRRQVLVAKRLKKGEEEEEEKTFENNRDRIKSGGAEQNHYIAAKKIGTDGNRVKVIMETNLDPIAQLPIFLTRNE